MLGHDPVPDPLHVTETNVTDQGIALPTTTTSIQVVVPTLLVETKQLMCRLPSIVLVLRVLVLKLLDVQTMNVAPIDSLHQQS